MRCVILTNCFLAYSLLAQVTNTEIAADQNDRSNQLRGAPHDSSMPTSEEKKDMNDSAATHTRGLNLREEMIENTIGDNFLVAADGRLELNGYGSCNFVTMNGNFRVVGTGSVNLASNSGAFYISSYGNGILHGQHWSNRSISLSTTVISTLLDSFQLESGKYFYIIAKDAVDMQLNIEGEYSVSGSGSFTGHGDGAYGDSVYWTGTSESIGKNSTENLVIPIGERFYLEGSFPDSRIELFGNDFFKCHSSDVSIRGVHVVQMKGSGSFSVNGDGNYILRNEDSEKDNISGEGPHSFSIVGGIRYTMKNATWGSASMTDSAGSIYTHTGPSTDRRKYGASSARGEFHLSAKEPWRCFGKGIFLNSYFVTKNTS